MTDDITKVGPVDPSKRTSAIAAENEEIAQTAAPENDEVRNYGCYFNGNFHGNLHHVCSGGHLLRCSGGHGGQGTWIKVGVC
ncbi:MAG: hypothetical protein OQK05_05580 [Pseudopelagicola sp.]|nr:hypothetical protein [Pseudopelagicola sp.]